MATNTVEYQRQWRAEHRELTREYDRKRRIREREKRRQYFRKRRKLIGRVLLEKRNKWYTLNPGARKAHGILHKAVIRGLIQKPSVCSRCNSETILHGHHTDYSKPLEVIWLCHSCHRLEHLRAKAIH